MARNVKNNPYYEQIMFLDDNLCDHILNVMFIAKDDDRKKYRVGYDEISLMNVMFRYLREYEGLNISKDFYDRFNSIEKQYPIEFYIHFIYTYYNLFKLKYKFDRCFLTNILDLYCLNDIEAIYNPDKFMMHYGIAYTDTLSLEEDVHPSLINYIDNNLPKDLENDLEKAIAIYILLFTVLRYAPIYTLTENYYDTTPYFEVTLDNNEVVCVQSAIILNKLFKKYGISNNLAGDINTHMYVNMSYGTMMIRFDPTRYGYFSEQLELSDITNLKYGFDITGIYIKEKNYVNIEYINYSKTRLSHAISSVYAKMGIKRGAKAKLSEFLDKFQKKEFIDGVIPDKKVFDSRIEEFNGIYVYSGDNEENVQYFNFLIYNMFADISGDKCENISLYKIVDGKIILNNLLVLYEDDRTQHFYILRDGKLVNYSVDDIVTILINEDWSFKHIMDVEALGIEDDTLIKRLIHE